MNKVVIFIRDKKSDGHCWAVQHWDDHEVIRVDLFQKDLADPEVTFTFPAQDLYEFIVGNQSDRKAKRTLVSMFQDKKVESQSAQIDKLTKENQELKETVNEMERLREDKEEKK